MRRLLAAAAIATTLLAGAGCTGGTDNAASPTTGATATVTPDTTAPASPSPGAVTATAGGNAKEVCAAVTKAGSESAPVFVSELAKLLQASSANDTKGAQEAQRNAQAALTSWATALKEQSAKATDPQLRAALADIGGEIATVKPDIKSIDEAKLEQLQRRVAQLCGS